VQDNLGPITTNKKDTSKIPKGLYCYIIVKNKEVKCPYWSRDDSPYREPQENGFCSYLEKGDWTLNEEKRTIEITINGVTKKYKNTSPHELGFNDSLLWDQVKECNVNDEIEDEKFYYTCLKCNCRHSIDSKIGKSHSKHIESWPSQ